MNRYIIVSDYDLHLFTSMVQQQMLNGWECQGGIFALQRPDGVRYYQAMVMEAV